MKWNDIPSDLKQAIQAYATARENDSWKGSADPQDWPHFRKALDKSRERLAAKIGELYAEIDRLKQELEVKI